MTTAETTPASTLTANETAYESDDDEDLGERVDPSELTEALTGDMLRALRAEANAAGNRRQAQLCSLALNGNKQARQTCVDAINDARVMSKPFVRVTA